MPTDDGNSMAAVRLDPISISVREPAAPPVTLYEKRRKPMEIAKDIDRMLQLCVPDDEMDALALDHYTFLFPAYLHNV